MGSKKICYYCGQPETSDEHIPPAFMFKGFNNDSITVPSCDTHNSEKSHMDQVIITALVIPLSNLKSSAKVFSNDVEKAISNTISSFPYTKNKVTSKHILQNPQGLPEVAYLQPTVKLTDWIKQLTAGWIYSAKNDADLTINWTDSMVWSPDYIYGEENVQPEKSTLVEIITKNKTTQQYFENNFNWVSGWSKKPRLYPPDVFNFQLAFTENNICFFQYRFYSQYTWFIRVACASDTILALKKRSEIGNM